MSPQPELRRNKSNWGRSKDWAGRLSFREGYYAGKTCVWRKDDQSQWRRPWSDGSLVSFWDQKSRPLSEKRLSRACGSSREANCVCRDFGNGIVWSTVRLEMGWPDVVSRTWLSSSQSSTPWYSLVRCRTSPWRQYIRWVCPRSGSKRLYGYRAFRRVVIYTA